MKHAGGSLQKEKLPKHEMSLEILKEKTQIAEHVASPEVEIGGTQSMERRNWFARKGQQEMRDLSAEVASLHAMLDPEPSKRSFLQDLLRPEHTVTCKARSSQQP